MKLDLDCLTLNKKATRPSETSVNIYLSQQSKIPEDSQQGRYENLQAEEIYLVGKFSLLV
jgi:hypothetical protein